MNAARGIVHKEFHRSEFTDKGRVLDMMHLCGNLPVQDKLGDPKYQEVLSADIARLDFTGGAGSVRDSGARNTRLVRQYRIVSEAGQGTGKPALVRSPVKQRSLGIYRGSATIP
jgi:redox-sensitive bicupin YhaK (pirin superfamily)